MKIGELTMADAQIGPKPTFQGPATYKIKVMGDLDISWSDRLESVNITRVDLPDGRVETVLVGRLGDQAALAGIINTLYNLRLPVVSVNCLDCD